jgi:hypothetical protein
VPAVTIGAPNLDHDLNTSLEALPRQDRVYVKPKKIFENILVQSMFPKSGINPLSLLHALIALLNIVTNLDECICFSRGWVNKHSGDIW